MDDQLAQKRQADLKLSQQISQPLKIQKSIADILIICQNVVEELQSMAIFLNVKLNLGQPVSYNQQVKEAIFTAIVEKELLKLILQKLLEIGLFLSNQNGKVSITPLRAENVIEVIINFDYYIPDPKKQNELFIQNYGSLNLVNNIKKGSGLEGVIAKNILDQLNIPLKVITKPETKQTSFVLYISI